MPKKQETNKDPRPGFERIDDGIMHSDGGAPMRCVCGKVMPEFETRCHAENCTILHMQRAVWRKNNRKEKP